jgi:AcrR family transcriptional regulator
MTTVVQKSSHRAAAEDALFDAAERLLVEVGYSGITTRRLAEEAGLNHGLVHYYFGSNENLLVQMLERFTSRLIARQEDLYASDMPFVEKWRTAMRHLMSDDVAYEKVWLELQAMGWNNAELRERLARVNGEWRSVLTEAFAVPHRELGIDMPLDGLVSLVVTFNIGVMVERLGGIETGHDELLSWIDGWLSS